MKKLGIVLLVYDIKTLQLKSAINILNFLFKDSKVIVVNNNKKNIYKNINCDQILGSNKLNEFSGYFEGLQALEKTLDLDRILFINDTLFTKKEPVYFLRKLALYSDSVQKFSGPSVTGFLDKYDWIFKQTSFEALGWISTFCFILNKNAVHIFKEIYLREGYKFINSKKINFYIDSHLKNKNFPHNTFKNFSKLNYSSRIKKISCVKFEHLLSSSVINNNGILVCINKTPVEKIYFYLLHKFRFLSKILIFFVTLLCLNPY